MFPCRLLIVARRGANAHHPHVNAQRLERDHQPHVGMRPRAQVDRGRLNALFFALSQEFQRPIDVRDTAEDARVRTGVEGAMAGRSQRGQFRGYGPRLLLGRGQVNVCAKEVGQQQVPLRLGVGVVAADDHRSQPQFCGHSGRLPRLIRLGCRRVYQHVATPLYGLGDLVFKLADLVAAKGQAGQIVALDPKRRAG